MPPCGVWLITLRGIVRETPTRTTFPDKTVAIRFELSEPSGSKSWQEPRVVFDTHLYRHRAAFVSCGFVIAVLARSHLSRMRIGGVSDLTEHAISQT